MIHPRVAEAPGERVTLRPARATASESDVRAVAEALAAIVPLDGGGGWSAHFCAQWPKDYSHNEQQIRLACARAAALTLLARGWIANG